LLSHDGFKFNNSSSEVSFFWFDVIPRGIIFSILLACSSPISFMVFHISTVHRKGDFRLLHYGGRAGVVGLHDTVFLVCRIWIFGGRIMLTPKEEG